MRCFLNAKNRNIHSVHNLRTESSETCSKLNGVMTTTMATKIQHQNVSRKAIFVFHKAMFFNICCTSQRITLNSKQTRAPCHTHNKPLYRFECRCALLLIAIVKYACGCLCMCVVVLLGEPSLYTQFTHTIPLNS